MIWMQYQDLKQQGTDKCSPVILLTIDLDLAAVAGGNGTVFQAGIDFVQLILDFLGDFALEIMEGRQATFPT